jgi:hypothetical protein
MCQENHEIQLFWASGWQTGGKALGCNPPESGILGKIFNHGFHGWHGWKTHHFLSVSSVKSVVQFF